MRTTRLEARWVSIVAMETCPDATSIAGAESMAVDCFRHDVARPLTSDFPCCRATGRDDASSATSKERPHRGGIVHRTGRSRHGCRWPGGTQLGDTPFAEAETRIALGPAMAALDEQERRSSPALLRQLHPAADRRADRHLPNTHLARSGHGDSGRSRGKRRI